MKCFLLTICMFTLLKSVTSSISSFCYWNSGCPYKYFSSKTPYNNVRGDIRDSIVKLKDCQPISVWALISNGKTNPDESLLKNFNECLLIRDEVVSSYKNGNCSLCAQDVENLENWKVDNIMLSKSNSLSEEGSQELQGISNRLYQTFPKLMRNFRKGNYKISSGSSNPAEESAKYFINSFKNEHLDIDTNNDELAVPHKSCKIYQKDTQETLTKLEVTKYMKTGDYYATKDRIQRRLGIKHRLTDDNIKSLYDLCRYTWSGIEGKSPWCALFTTEDLRVLEYIEDLESYYMYGYGVPANELLGRLPVVDLLQTFYDVTKEGEKTFVAHFTDTATMNTVCTALGLFKDEIPLSVTSKNAKRKWRNSKISAFSTNLIAVLNKCDNKGTKDNNIVFYWNEEPLLSVCERGYCSWDEFEYKLKSFLETNLTNIC